MSTTTYKGLTVLSPEPSAAGGLLVQNNFKALADFHAAHTGNLSNPHGLTPGQLGVYTSGEVEAKFTDTELLGVATATTPEFGDDTTKIATTEFIENMRNVANGFAGLDGSGNLVGIFIPRRGTSAYLSEVVLNPGEIATTTDTNQILLGTSSGTNYFVGSVLSSQSVINVNANGTVYENGTALKAAYLTAKNLLPYNLAKSSTNRVCIIIPPGTYDFGDIGLKLDTHYIDMYGFTRDNTILQSSDNYTAEGSNGSVVYFGAANTAFTPTSIISSGTTAYLTKASHGLVSGNWIIVSGALPDEYNGTYEATRITTGLLSYTVSNMSNAVASGTISAKKVSNISSLYNMTLYSTAAALTEDDVPIEPLPAALNYDNGMYGWQFNNVKCIASRFSGGLCDEIKPNGTIVGGIFTDFTTYNENFFYKCKCATNLAQSGGLVSSYPTIFTRCGNGNNFGNSCKFFDTSPGRVERGTFIECYGTIGAFSTFSPYVNFSNCRTNSTPYNISTVGQNFFTTYSSGTPYTVTNTMSRVKFGSVTPEFVWKYASIYPQAGTNVKLRSNVHVYASGATLANQDLTLQLCDVNITTALSGIITNSNIIVTLPSGSIGTQTLFTIDLPEVIHITNSSITSNVIEIQAKLSSLPSVGSVLITNASIIAEVLS